MPPTSKIHTYKADDITVNYDVKRCIHAEECVSRLRAVFDPQKRPWIQPGNASADAVADAIHHCPTGALKYTREDGIAEAIPDENTVRLDADGPLVVRGDFEVIAADGAPIIHDTRMALCRCGASKNKPYCDNSHIEAGFADAGLAAPDAEAVADVSVGRGLARITPTTNGPLQITGEVEIFNAAGERIFRGDECWLCRCGGSQNKPFCDSTHERNGFTAE